MTFTTKVKTADGAVGKFEHPPKHEHLIGCPAASWSTLGPNRRPSMSEPKDGAREEGHDMPWHTEACFQRSGVITCDGSKDTRRCNVCGKEWTESCNFDEEYS